MPDWSPPTHPTSSNGRRHKPSQGNAARPCSCCLRTMGVQCELKIRKIIISIKSPMAMLSQKDEAQSQPRKGLLSPDAKPYSKPIRPTPNPSKVPPKSLVCKSNPDSVSSLNTALIAIIYLLIEFDRLHC